MPANHLQDDDHDHIRIAIDDVFSIAIQALLHAGLSPAQALPLARTITAAERDECFSHGLYRLPGCTETIKSPKFVANAIPVIAEISVAAVRADARYGYSPLAFEKALPLVEQKAKLAGICILAINNCFHCTALWPEIEALTERGLAAIAMTSSHSWVAPAGGTQPTLGTNPFAFGWPRHDERPYVFDFATSIIARGDIALHYMGGKPIPLGWALDVDGNPTTNAAAALSGAMLSFGGHKGTALSTMIELLAGPLIGDMTSRQSKEFGEDARAAPCHGELIIALDPALLGWGTEAANQASAEQLFSAFAGQGARLPSRRRYEARERTMKNGVRVPKELYERLQSLLPSGGLM
jgi:LDH2 family malate/lactate/ureidoglycolate dehydrogenase